MPLLKGRLYSLPKQNLFHISRKEFLLLFRNTCRQCEACLEAGDWHFETLISVMAIWVAGEEWTPSRHMIPMWQCFIDSCCNQQRDITYSPCYHFRFLWGEHLRVVHFYSCSQNCDKRPLASSCVSIFPLGTTQPLLDRFSWNLIFEYFSKLCQENLSFLKIRQE